MAADFVNFFDILARYKSIAPKNLEELAEFEELCREEGKEDLANVIQAWRLNLEYHVKREFSE